MVATQVLIIAAFAVAANAQAIVGNSVSGIDYEGGDVNADAPYKAANPEQCQWYCQKFPTADLWELKPAGECWCKIKANTVRTNKQPGVVAGFILKSCMETDLDFPGGDIGHLKNVKSPQECQDICSVTSGCEYWTHYEEPASVAYGCHLKNKKNPPTNKAACISGPVQCPVATTTVAPTPAIQPTVGGGGSDCFEVDIAYPGNKFIKNTNALSPADCQKDCENTAGCVTWTWLPKSVSKGPNEACNLKATSNNRRTKKGAVSGPKTCSAPPSGSSTISPVTEILPPQTTTMAPPKPPGVKLGVRCNSKSPPCAEPNSACITYRCKCKKTFVRYPRNGDNCIEQTRLELGTPCTNPGLACSATNSECRAYRCFCKAGYKMSADGQECE